jgi:hypothetical protein
LQVVLVVEYVHFRGVTKWATQACTIPTPSTKKLPITVYVQTFGENISLSLKSCAVTGPSVPTAISCITPEVLSMHDLDVLQMLDSNDGKFLRWKHVSHNVKQIHDTAEYYMKKECHSQFNQWKMKGVENFLFGEANKQTGGHFENYLNQGNIDDVVNVGSETLLPDLEPQQAAGTQVDARDGMSCLTDPTSPNLAFTLPQMATKIYPFPHQLTQQAARNVEEVNRRNESLEAENC